MERLNREVKIAQTLAPFMKDDTIKNAINSAVGIYRNIPELPAVVRAAQEGVEFASKIANQTCIAESANVTVNPKVSHRPPHVVTHGVHSVNSAKVF